MACTGLAALCCASTRAMEVQVQGACRLTEGDRNQLELQLEGESGEGRLVLRLDEQPLDLSAFSHVAIDAHNGTGGRLEVRIHIAGDSERNQSPVETRYFLNAGESKELKLLLLRGDLPETSPWRQRFGEIRALPGGHQSRWAYADPANISRVEFEVRWEGLSGDENSIRFSTPRGSGPYLVGTGHPDDLPVPLIDPLGQLNGEQWAGRVNDPGELPRDGERDLATYANHPVLPGFSPYGGWLGGPRFEATGHFHTRKVDGRWWFVDPEGYLFWSHGVTCVARGTATPTSGRERLFTLSGAMDDSPAPASGSDRYAVATSPKTYDFYDSNLYRKYGTNWESAHQAVTFGRMRAWGLNTSGAWSHELVLGAGRVPYTLILNPRLQRLGALEKIPDPFSAEYRNSLRQQLAEAAKRYKGDPWNLGIFISNEMHWGKRIALPLTIIGLENGVPAKQAMVRFLKRRHGQIHALNEAWGTGYATFDAIDGKQPPTRRPTFQADMEAYLAFYAETYFALCAAAVREFMPGHLYLGCRFHGAVFKANPTVLQAASRHCDVVSFNIYQVSAAEFDPPIEKDCPYLIGEFHFGTGSHGVWGIGLGYAMDLDHQAELYAAYVNGVLEHPNMIGSHWFLWSDHPTTGRFDGENYRVGLVSIVDRPYDPLTRAIHNVAAGMYPRRAGMAMNDRQGVETGRSNANQAAPARSGGPALHRVSDLNNDTVEMP